MNKFTVDVAVDRVAGDGVSLEVARAGKGRPVVLLHGFPENWHSWRHQIPAIASAGYSVLAPNLRGYPGSDIPRDKNAYGLLHLVADVTALVRASGFPRVTLVGHDWGGVIAWAFARLHPDLLDRLVILNAPHPEIYVRKAKRPPQMFKSWYVLFFLLPGVSEFALSAGGFRAVRDMFRRYPARRGTFSEEDIDRYVAGLSHPGALTAALNYYRANVRLGVGREWPPGTIDVDTLIVWGEQDPALDAGLLDGLDRLVPRLRVHRVPHASHWVQNEVPGEVNRVLTEFLTT
jgi:pimeloyl-ACP methyl ester carboxylesterase